MSVIVRNEDHAHLYKGNYLKLHMDLIKNDSQVAVIGNRCNLTIETHNGTLKIIGDNCQVDIANGNGIVKYIGNGGRIRFASKIDIINENITCTTCTKKKRKLVDEPTTMTCKLANIGEFVKWTNGHYP